MKRALTLSFAVTCVCAWMLLGQQAGQMPKPSPEHEKLDYFVGKWTTTGEMKQTPFMPAGKFTGSDDNEWQPGGFFLILHSTGELPMGKYQELAVMGYSAAEKAYTYDGYNSMGEHETSKGTLEGNTWTWLGEQKMEGKVIKGRFVQQVVSPTSYTFKYDVSVDGGPWTNVMEGKSTKQ